MEILVRNQKGDTAETVVLDDGVFNVPMNHSVVHQALVIYQLNKRQGTHDTKTRAQVSGGGRKPWIQKTHRPGPPGKHPRSAVAARRCGVRASSPQLP